MTQSLEQSSDEYRNPMLPGFNPDPSVVRVDKDFFCVTSSFEYFPALPIYHGTDLVRWRLVGHALTRATQLHIQTPEPGAGIWAPTLRYHNGYFYVTTCCFERYRPQFDDRVFPRGFYVYTNDIWNSSSWSDPIVFDQPGFDQDLFWDDDGTAYLSVTRRKIDRDPRSKLKDLAVHITTVDLSTGNSTSPPLLIRESPSGVAEGSHLFKRGAFYYLLTAEGGTEAGHCEYVMRSACGPFGPWESAPHNPILRSTSADEVQNTGHCDIFDDLQGRSWAVCLGVRPVRRGAHFEPSVFGRETFLMPVTWHDDWPVFNHNMPVCLAFKDHDLYSLAHPVTWRDNFDAGKLQLGWYRKNTPTKLDFVVSEGSSSLRLDGGPYDLSSHSTPTLFLRKQTHRPAVWSTRLSFKPTSYRSEAGTVVWWNHETYYSIGIRCYSGGSTSRFLRVRKPSGEETRTPLMSESAEIELFVDCQLSKYRLGFREVPRQGYCQDEKGRLAIWIDEISSTDITLDPQLGASFTGMMLGLYAFGEMERCLEPATFRYASFA